MMTWAVALDGGTTNTRARLVDLVHERVVATARRTVGVRDAILSGVDVERPLERAVREVLEEVIQEGGGTRPSLIVAAGMLSSEVGLTPVPHVVAPAGLEELARGAVVRRLSTVSDEPIVFIPGVRTPASPGIDGWAEADVMRGEECETLGAWLHLSRPGSKAGADTPTIGSTDVVFLWPGSHTKLIAVDPSGRIVRSQTSLAGELFEALARHTLLAASLPFDLPDHPESEAVEAGARLVEREGLGRAAFLVRIAALTDTLTPPARAAFWIGAVVADDVAHLSRHPILRQNPPVLVGGRQPLRNLYASRLGQRHAAPVIALDDETVERASAMGALAVARRHRAIR